MLAFSYDIPWTDRFIRTTALGSIALADRWSMVPTSAYKISKTALNMLNKHWSMDYADKGFTFLLVSPGVSILCACLIFSILTKDST